MLLMHSIYQFIDLTS